MSSIDFNLYLITDRDQTKGNLIEAIEEALKAGVKAIQVREKDLTIREQMNLAITMKKLTDHYHASLFINDRVDVALCAKAAGVHLGESSIPVDAVRRMVKNELLIGVSTHNIKEAMDAQGKGADFITLGPVFDTPSKRKYGTPVGLEVLRKAKDRLEIQVFAIGGIKSHNIKEVKRHKGDGIALISGILSSDNTFEETKNYLKILNE